MSVFDFGARTFKSQVRPIRLLHLAALLSLRSRTPPRAGAHLPSSSRSRRHSHIAAVGALNSYDAE